MGEALGLPTPTPVPYLVCGLVMREGGVGIVTL